MAEVVIKNCESVFAKAGRYRTSGTLLDVEIEADLSEVADAIDWDLETWVGYLMGKFKTRDLLDEINDRDGYESGEWARDNYPSGE